MALPDLEIDVLRCFVTVADAGGFTIAGERLGRSQSAVSIKIRKLEEAIGRKVFARTSRSLSLTRDGELLLASARRILRLQDETRALFAEPEAQGELRLGVSDYFVPRRLPGVLARFAARYPSMHLDVSVGVGSQLVEALDAGALDLVIARRDDAETRGRVIHREELRWVASPALPLHHDPLPVCALPAPCVFRGRTLAALAAIGRPWRVVYTSTSVLGVLAAVHAGLGLAVIGEGSLSSELRQLGAIDGFPPLGSVDLAVFGEDRGKRELNTALVGYIEDALRARPPRLAA